MATAAAIAFARITGVGSGLAARLSPWLPIDPWSFDSLDAVTAGFALASLAIGVRRRKRLAWPMAIALFTAAALAQVLVLRHPLGAALALGCLAVLLWDAPRYRVETGHRMRSLALGVMVIGVGVLVVGSVIVDVAGGTQPGALVDRLAGWMSDALSVVDPTGLVATGRLSILLEILEFTVQAAVLVAAVAVLSADPDRPPTAELERRRATTRRYASGSLAPFQASPETWLFADGEANEDGAGHVDGAGVIAYGRAGRTAVVLGEPIGPNAAAWRAFRAFEKRCSSGDVAVSVYQVGPEVGATLGRQGYRVFRVGLEPVIALGRFDFRSPRKANLRHTVGRARRGGIEVRWLPDGLGAEQIARWADELLEVDRAWRSSHGPTMRFTVSSFDPAALVDAGVAIATDARGRIAAFATFRRTRRDEWVLDLTRRRLDATPGALESCIATAAEAMRAAGDGELSLGLVALAGTSWSKGPLEERLLAIGRHIVRPWYDVDGLLFFKEKFDPDLRPRFGAVRGRAGIIGFAVALIRLHLDIHTAAPPHAVAAGGSHGMPRAIASSKHVRG